MKPLSLLFSLLLLAGCAPQSPTNTSPADTPAPPTEIPEASLGAGFRYSSYGPAYNPGPEYWASVGFQYGYPADKVWWQGLSDPPKDIGQSLLENVPNTQGLFWVDFTALDLFPPK